jgi:hypothetical protein
VPRARDFCRISRRENGVDIADSFSPRYGSTGRGVGVEGSVRLVVYAFVSTMAFATTPNDVLNSGSLHRGIAAIITA